MSWKSTLALLVLINGLQAQTTFTACDVPAGTAGTSLGGPWTTGSDFTVLKPITISHLGVFDHLSDGIRGNNPLVAQLYLRSGNSGTLLETVTFDAADSGALVGGNRFKPLVVPVTLLPGTYTIAVWGFDETNRCGDVGREPYTTNAPVPWTFHSGGGLVRFEQGRHASRSVVNQFPRSQNPVRADYYAAGSFMFDAAQLPVPSYATDYAALTRGVQNFPFGFRRRTGSIALFSPSAFPVIVEPSGNRLILEAASSYENDSNRARCVAFSHPQWAHAEGDARAKLFENAIRWASRKDNPGEIVIGLGPLLNTNYLRGLGYQVKPFAAQLAASTEGLPACDVLVVDWHGGFDDAAATQIAKALAEGTSLVVSVSPWLLVHGGVQPAFPQLNLLLRPFGLAFRPSTTIVYDHGFTNIAAQPYPTYFSAYPAAELLARERQGLVRLGSLDKLLALHTIQYALNARPDLMNDLAGIGRRDTPRPLPGSVTNFADVVVLNGRSATANRLGPWTSEGNDVVAADRRGAVEYDFVVAEPDIYRLEIEGAQNLRLSWRTNFNIILSVDGQSLGQYELIATSDKPGTVQALTPYLAAGRHTLRVWWDNAFSATAFRIKNVRVQAAAGEDADKNGIKDWVDAQVQARSGFEGTNDVVFSQVSPVCLEGREQYPSLIRLNGANVTVHPAPNRRWYADVPLLKDQHTPLMVNLVYQNGALSEWRRIQWVPVNVFTSSNLVVRRGDSLLLTARPEGAPDAPIEITIGTNRLLTTATNPLPHRFTEAGVFTVNAAYGAPEANRQTRSISVNVVAHSFTNHPNCWVAVKRDWDLPAVAPGVVLEADDQLFFQQTATLADGARRISLIADQNEPRFVVSRLGANGPILSSARVNGFKFWHGGETYINVIRTYPDSSQLVEMLLVLSPVLNDLTVRVDLIVGGVVFEDGTTRKDLTALDFDSRGQCTVRFVRPASAETSVCHALKVFQGTVLVGTVQ